MNSKIISVCLLTVLSAILLLSLTSAAVTLAFSPAATNASGNPGATVQLAVGLNNSDNSTYSLAWSSTTVSPSSTGVSTLTSLPNQITAYQNLSSTASFTIPSILASGSLPGSYTYNIQVNASNATESHVYSLPVTVVVNPVYAISVSTLQDLSKTQNATINISNTGNTALTNVNLTQSGDYVVVFRNGNSIGNIPVGSSVTASIYPKDVSTLKFGPNTVTITATDLNTASNVSASTSLVGLSKSFCANGPTEKRNLTINDITINSVLGTDEKWRPLDSITFDVEIKNLGKDTVDDVYVVMALYNAETGEDVTGSLDFNNSDAETFDLGSITDGERETATFEFSVPADFEKGTYKLAVKAYSKDLGEDVECIDSSSKLSSNKLYKEIRVERYSSSSDEGKFIAFDEVKLSPSDAVCGDTMIMTLKAANVGSKNQKQVKVNLVSKELGLDQSLVLKNGLDQGEDKVLTFSFEVPQVADKTYTLSLTADYDYSDSTYHVSTEEATRVPLKVFGCSTVAGRSALVTAQVASDSEKKAGTPLTVKVTVKNLGNITLPFVVSAKSFDSWADLSSISDQLVNLAPGESKDITLVLNVKSGISGTQNLLVEARSSSIVETQELEVEIAKSSWLPESLQGNAMVWVIGALNVLLVLIIIVVAVRVARR